MVLDQKRDAHGQQGNPRPLLVPGVFDALSARIAEMAGFPVVTLSGYATSASVLGMPDFGLLTQTEVIRTACYVRKAVKIAITVDADTGYGGPINVIRTVRELEDIGVQGMILEDQLWPKRCGHMEGKEVIPMEEYEQKLLAALEARRNPAGFRITARTDARGPLGLDEAIKRANRYRELGADAIFVEAPQSREELRIIRENVPGPLVANMIEGGKTPVLTLDDFQELGYQAVGFVLTSIFAAAKAMKEALLHLKNHGTSLGFESNLVMFDEFTDIVGLPQIASLEKKYSLKPL